MMELLYTQHNTTFSLLLQQGMENNDQQQRNQNNERKQRIKTKMNDLRKHQIVRFHGVSLATM